MNTVCRVLNESRITIDGWWWAPSSIGYYTFDWFFYWMYRVVVCLYPLMVGHKKNIIENPHLFAHILSLFVPLLILHCCPRPRLCLPACLPFGLEGLEGHITVRIKSTLAGTLKGRSRTTTSDISFSAFYPPASLSVWRHDIILKQQPRPLDNDKSKQPYSMEHTYTHPANKERAGGGQKKPTRCFFPDFFRFSRILNFRAEMRCRHATSAYFGYMFVYSATVWLRGIPVQR